jgi:hypothetical protein
METLAVIPANANFYAVDTRNSLLVGATAQNFASIVTGHFKTSHYRAESKPASMWTLGSGLWGQAVDFGVRPS